MGALKASLNLIFTGFFFIACHDPLESKKPLARAPKIDLSRLGGDWFVPVRIPTMLDMSATDVRMVISHSASHSLNLKWSYKSHPESSPTTWRLTATLANESETTSWVLSPFWPIKFRYQVIEYSADYSWLVLGTKDRKNLWILSRKMNPPTELVDELISRLQASEFDIANIVREKNNKPY